MSLQYMQTFKQQVFDPETVRYLLADLQLIREKFLVHDFVRGEMRFVNVNN